MGIFYCPVIYDPLDRLITSPLSIAQESVFRQILRLLFVSSSSITGRNTTCNSSQWNQLVLTFFCKDFTVAVLRASAFHTELSLILKLPCVSQTNCLAPLGSLSKDGSKVKKLIEMMNLFLGSLSSRPHIMHFHLNIAYLIGMLFWHY